MYSYLFVYLFLIEGDNQMCSEYTVPALNEIIDTEMANSRYKFCTIIYNFINNYINIFVIKMSN